MKEFPLGFIVSTEYAVSHNITPPDFNIVNFGAFTISHDSGLKLLSSSTQYGGTVAILGDAYLDNIPETSMGDVLALLCSSLEVDEARFYSTLKNVWGRFCIIYHNDGKTVVLPDATASKAVFYTSSRKSVCASHPYLLSSILNNEFPLKWGYPGNRTPLKGVKMLTPNTALELEKGVRRFYPGQMPLSVTARSPKEAAEDFILSARNLLPELYKRKNKVCLTLTGGLDSRVSLALLILCVPEFKHKTRFITYLNHNKQHGRFDADVDVSKLIAERFGLDHIVFDRESYKSDPDLFNIKKSTYYSHGPALVPAYRDLIGDGATHLRSNTYEIGRSFYRDKGYSILEGENVNYGDELAKVYHKSVAGAKNAKHFYSDPVNIRELKKAFSEYCHDVDFESAANSGLDPLDLMYWEHRVGSWVSHINIETDFVFDTLTMPNSWRNIENMLSVDLLHRKEMSIFKEILKRADEFLYQLPINPASRDELNID
ncbi:hypothetical protein [Vibrio sp. HN007]|uniref:hypothetical protein n=1 Tax=Vibrio iocasae TaxID=3098914 RepID=UPI0035D4D170